ncbi:hypothetical protein [Agrococcus sp. TF02-05]|uniref:hypothetical protein n=1 Tax=Agrococcus sp. TF02-05 TaxID=2815211 RepID=UPI001AA1CB95|nr:hypothetical protein [Agrococcus sp. TF02-05]MBO1770467.1 hypothetical protein [Agrococcus sp. TF02-05]
MSVKTCPKSHRHDDSTTCYTTHGCRCQRCRDGRALYVADRDAYYATRTKRAAAVQRRVEPKVRRSPSTVDVTLTPRDALMLAEALEERAVRIHRAAATSGVQAPILRSTAARIHHLAQQVHAAAGTRQETR